MSTSIRPSTPAITRTDLGGEMNPEEYERLQEEARNAQRQRQYRIAWVTMAAAIVLFTLLVITVLYGGRL